MALNNSNSTVSLNHVDNHTCYTVLRPLRLRSSRHADGIFTGIIEPGCYVRILELRGRRARLECGSDTVGWAHIGDKRRAECYVDPAPSNWEYASTVAKVSEKKMSSSLKS